jgi:hypothetical protein
MLTGLLGRACRGFLRVVTSASLTMREAPHTLRLRSGKSHDPYEALSAPLHKQPCAHASQAEQQVNRSQRTWVTQSFA